MYVVTGGVDLDKAVQRAMKQTEKDVAAINGLEVVGSNDQVVGKVGEIKNPKYQDDPSKRGLGMYHGIAEITPTSQADAIRKTTGNRVEQAKKGKKQE